MTSGYKTKRTKLFVEQVQSYIQEQTRRFPNNFEDIDHKLLWTFLKRFRCDFKMYSECHIALLLRIRVAYVFSYESLLLSKRLEQIRKQTDRIIVGEKEHRLMFRWLSLLSHRIRGKDWPYFNRTRANLHSEVSGFWRRVRPAWVIREPTSVLIQVRPLALHYPITRSCVELLFWNSRLFVRISPIKVKGKKEILKKIELRSKQTIQCLRIHFVKQAWLSLTKLCITVMN